MRIQEWGYKDEQSFVKEAMVSMEKRHAFKEFNKPLIEGVAKLFVQQHHLNDFQLTRLKIIGLNSFDEAFNHYIQLANAFENKSFLFSTYFVTPLRKAMEQYLEKSIPLNKSEFN